MDYIKKNYERIKFQLEFIRHFKNMKHRISEEDVRLKEVIVKQFYKSVFGCNLIAIYINYIRKNKSISKTLSSKI